MINQRTVKNRKNKLKQIIKTNGVITAIYGEANQYAQALTIDNLIIILFENSKHIIECINSKGKAVIIDGSEITYYHIPQEEREL